MRILTLYQSINMSPKVVLAIISFLSAGSAYPVDLHVTTVTPADVQSSLSWASQEVTPSPALTTGHFTDKSPITIAELPVPTVEDTPFGLMPSEKGQQGESADLVLPQQETADVEAASSTDVTVAKLISVTSRSRDTMETAFREVCSSLAPHLQMTSQGVQDDIFKRTKNWNASTLTLVKGADPTVYWLVKRDWQELKDQCADIQNSESEEELRALEDARSRLKDVMSLLEQYLQPGTTEEQARTTQTPLSTLFEIRVERALKLASYMLHLNALLSALDSWTQA